MRTLISILVAVAVVAASGCARSKRADDAYREPLLSDLPFVYKMTVQQGNIVTEEMVDQLQMGMTKSQVRYLLGTPLLADMFHTNRWDYTYTLQRGHAKMEIRPLTLYFEEDALSRIDGTMRPNPARAETLLEEPREVVVEVPDWRDDRGLIRRALNAIGVEPED
jgi:outer membrane protein assembly factor BamE